MIFLHLVYVNIVYLRKAKLLLIAVCSFEYNLVGLQPIYKNRFVMKYLSITLLFLFVLAACEKEPTQAEKDDDIIKKYLADNGIEAEYHESGLYYQIIEPGTDGHPDFLSTVTVKYKGYLTDNEVFNDTGNNSKEFKLIELIAGWQIGIPLLQKGGSGIFYTPSGLAYGSQGKGSIPPNTVLIFEIELVDFWW